MTELDRVSNSDNFNFMGIPSFLQVLRSAHRQRESLHGDGSAISL